MIEAESTFSVLWGESGSWGFLPNRMALCLGREGGLRQEYVSAYASVNVFSFVRYIGVAQLVPESFCVQQYNQCVCGGRGAQAPPYHHLGRLSCSHISLDNKACLLFLCRLVSTLHQLFYRHCSNSVGRELQSSCNLLRNTIVATDMLRVFLHLKYVPQHLTGSYIGSVVCKLFQNIFMK